jgi:2,4-dienoyl-CoA reductase-like NADH-dependent reductase (Old Yellow Enzyme family)
MPDDWHLVHLGSRAVGGAAAVIAEATAVSPEGRITPRDTGIWNDEQARAWARIAGFVIGEGAIAGIQLAHAGRKASCAAPWHGGRGLLPDEGGWTPLAPSAIPYDHHHPLPEALDEAGIAKVIADFVAAARRALEAGFQLVEVHAAHGYLLHSFLSPLSNRREDRYGGSFENRTRLLLEVLAGVRAAWPQDLPMWLRMSASDWAEGGWTIDDSVALAKLVGTVGVDVVDVSSGNLLPNHFAPAVPGYHVAFAARIRNEAHVATGAVGLITEPAQADAIVRNGEADLILLARELLRDPYFPRRAAQQLGVEIEAPEQYQRAW